jgi:sugar lactone lactonase YvrE
LLNFSADGRLKLAFGKKGDQPGQMSLPVALTLKQGRIYVADTAQHCLHKFAEDGSFLLQIKSDPSRGAIIDVPGGLCFRGEELWAVDRGLARVCCFDVEGKYLGGFGDHGIINSPLSVRSDDEGLFILEKNGIIKKFLPMGQQIAGFQTGCLEPRGFEVDPWGTIWVCDARQMQVVRFNQKGRVLATIKAPPGPRPWMPTGVAMRKDGMLAVSDAENKKIHIFSAESN